MGFHAGAIRIRSPFLAAIVEQGVIVHVPYCMGKWGNRLTIKPGRSAIAGSRQSPGPQQAVAWPIVGFSVWFDAAPEILYQAVPLQLVPVLTNLTGNVRGIRDGCPAPGYVAYA